MSPILSSHEVAVTELSTDLVEYFGKPFLAACSCPVADERGNYWPGLMMRPSSRGPFATVKHVLLRTYLEQAAEDSGRVELRQRSGSLGHYALEDGLLADEVHKVHLRLVENDLVMTSGELLRQLGAWQFYCSHRNHLPRTREAVRTFRLSTQCHWRIREK